MISVKVLLLLSVQVLVLFVKILLLSVEVLLLLLFSVRDWQSAAVGEPRRRSRRGEADEVLAEGLDVARFRGDPLFARERLEVLGELLELLPWLLASAWRWSCFPRLPATAWRWSFSPVFW
jgi:hypothetical protein